MTPGGAFATIVSGEVAAKAFIISKMFLVGSLGACHVVFGGGGLALTLDGWGISVIPSCFIGGGGDARGGVPPKASTVVVAVNVAVAARCEGWISVSRAYFFRLAGQVLLGSMLGLLTAVVVACCWVASLGRHVVVCGFKV